MSWFAIKQISTGLFIPPFPKNQSKGGTWLEPTDKAPPRLFRRRQDAKIALEHWLRGTLTRTYRGPTPPDFVDEGDYDEYYEPVAGRSADDMAIVEVYIAERLCA